MLKIFSSSSDALFENPRHCFLSQYVTREKQFFVLVTPVLAVHRLLTDESLVCV